MVDRDIIEMFPNFMLSKEVFKDNERIDYVSRNDR